MHLLVEAEYMHLYVCDRSHLGERLAALLEATRFAHQRSQRAVGVVLEVCVHMCVCIVMCVWCVMQSIKVYSGMPPAPPASGGCRLGALYSNVCALLCVCACVCDANIERRRGASSFSAASERWEPYAQNSHLVTSTQTIRVFGASTGNCARQQRRQRARRLHFLPLVCVRPQAACRPHLGPKGVLSQRAPILSNAGVARLWVVCIVIVSMSGCVPLGSNESQL